MICGVLVSFIKRIHLVAWLDRALRNGASEMGFFDKNGVSTHTLL